MKIDEIVGKIDPEVDYKIKEVCEMFGVTSSAISGAIARGNLEARKIFGKYYIKGRSIRNYLLGEKQPKKK